MAPLTIARRAMIGAAVLALFGGALTRAQARLGLMYATGAGVFGVAGLAGSTARRVLWLCHSASRPVQPGVSSFRSRPRKCSIIGRRLSSIPTDCNMTYSMLR